MTDKDSNHGLEKGQEKTPEEKYKVQINSGKAKRGRKQALEIDDMMTTCVKALFAAGLSKTQVSAQLGISLSTLNRYLILDKNLKIAALQGQSIANTMVEQALFSRAVGFSTTETKVGFYEGVPSTIDVDKHLPPDTNAAIFWLKNRDPDRWKDKSDVGIDGKLATFTLAYDPNETLVAKERPDASKETESKD